MTSPSKHTTEWLVLAGLFLLAAIWQAQVITVATRNPSQPNSLPPRNTHHTVRPTSHPEIDPVADYIARSEKGLNDQEIRWIAEDFIAAGLDRLTDAVAPGQQAFQMRSALNRWYLSSLIDALGLNPQQSAQAAAKLADLTRQSKIIFPDVGSFNSDSLINVGLAEWGSTLDGKLMPWELCELDAEQEKITSKRYFDVRDLSMPIPPTPPGDPDFQIKYLSFPSSAYYGNFLLLGSNNFEIANFFTPLLSSQKLPPQGLAHISESKMLDEIRKLHPAQLKVMMMLLPQIAKQLLNHLDSGQSPQRIEPGP